MDVSVHNNPILTALSSCRLFKSVEWQTISQLAKTSKLVCLERGQTVFRSGDSDLGLYLLTSGQVKVSILASNGSERVIDIVSPGETFGEDGLFSSMFNQLNAVMLVKGKIIEVPRKSIENCLARCPSLVSCMLTHLSSKLCRLVGELENCCLRSARHRVIDYLLILANKQHPGSDGAINIQLPASKGITASLLDITPETFSRELNRLIGKGLIQVERKSIEILDLQQLQQSIN